MNSKKDLRCVVFAPVVDYFRDIVRVNSRTSVLEVTTDGYWYLVFSDYGLAKFVLSIIEDPDFLGAPKGIHKIMPWKTFHALHVL